MKFIPWKSLLRRLAREHGFLDPLALLARLQQFSQPSEVNHPIELLRAGASMHGRGLLNARIIQHNLDWLWPYWVQRQFDPADEAFVPRAFSLTHINLTHRNWTAVGLPGVDALPIVDPAGLVTPFWDRWSLDAWLQTESGSWLSSARTGEAEQSLTVDADAHCVATVVQRGGTALVSRAFVTRDGEQVNLHIDYMGHCAVPGRLAISVRPFNPEGVALVDEIAVDDTGRHWRIDDDGSLTFDRVPDACMVSDYAAGDVYLSLDAPPTPARRHVRCPSGMASGVALFDLPADEPLTVRATVPLRVEHEPRVQESWPAVLRETCRLKHPIPHYEQLFNAARNSLILLSPHDVYPGPYTYRRFWFRDAAFMLEALLTLGLSDRVARVHEHFAARQTGNGYFLSQEGEWDSNGAALWSLARYFEMTNCAPDADTLRMVRNGADWIINKLKPADDPGDPHRGLMPAGFSAEHLGPNDYYYWDNFWSIAGLRAAAALLAASDADTAARLHDAAARLEARVDDSLLQSARRLGRLALPAAPTRRLDAGAIGSICADYPLRITAPADPRLLDTVDYLLDAFSVRGGFFQDMIHSGVNAYLSLHLAQVLLRAGDERYLDLIDAVATLASPTGQWPEAIHPRTGGGCMGDGHHGWAAAEWVLMLRNCFVREEAGNTLVLASGIPSRWLESGKPVELSGARTAHGSISVTVEGSPAAPRVRWHAQWHGEAPELIVAMPGFARRTFSDARGEAVLNQPPDPEQ